MEFKTKGGTSLTLMDIKGKKYLPVQQRVIWFREEHPDWGIETEIVSSGEKFTVSKATIKDHLGRVIAQGTKREDAGHFADHVEKSETSAIGRALALCGYGTQFADELEEGERIVDAPREPKQLFSNAKPPAGTTGQASKPASTDAPRPAEPHPGTNGSDSKAIIPFGKYKGQDAWTINDKELTDYLEDILKAPDHSRFTPEAKQTITLIAARLGRTIKLSK